MVDERYRVLVIEQDEATRTVLATVLADAGLATGIFGGCFAAARTAFNAICRSRRRRAENVMRALEKLIARPVSENSRSVVVERVTEQSGQVQGGESSSVRTGL